jgi:hypothetical protein
MIYSAAFYFGLLKPKKEIFKNGDLANQVSLPKIMSCTTINHTGLYVTQRYGRAIAQVVSRWLPTAAARVRARVWSSGICGGQNGAGAGFLRVLRFPLPIIIPPIAPQSPSSIIWGCTIGQKWPQYLVT